jgi:hypothetical protein
MWESQLAMASDSELAAALDLTLDWELAKELDSELVAALD